MAGVRRPTLALADTSLVIAQEQVRSITGEPPERVMVSVVTVGELSLGVLVAEGDARAQRLQTLRRAEALGGWCLSRSALRAEAADLPLNSTFAM